MAVPPAFLPRFAPVQVSDSLLLLCPAYCRRHSEAAFAIGQHQKVGTAVTHYFHGCELLQAPTTN